ncbi:MAG: DinB family protein [Acidobacteria bacterium]|nr:DinB family protein [Acidobacteriota bacterium]
MSVSQTVSRSGGEVDGFVAELRAIAEDARKVFGRLTPAQLNWKPSTEEWSVGQCFDHLITTNTSFFPDMERVAAGKHRNGAWARVSPLSGFFGRFILGALDPEKGRKIKAPRAFLPTSSDVDADVIGRFERNLSEAAARMRATEGVDLGRTILTSPAMGLVTYSLLDVYRIFVAHGRKHFEQARRVTRSEGFPGV